ncbi:DUF5330 domain-containing protein [Xanthobacter pseudotagetidis]|uniref:DUF5330 domain-containing protein n=1 Tax=Xanthobacter pseudotagetidis TaxID=3119911 RepID=UPI00372A1650
MFFLLRMGFLLAVVLALLPLGLKGESGRDVSVFEAFGLVQAVIADARGFCDRQPQACDVGGQMVVHFKEKAQVGARWLYEAMGDATATDAPKTDAPKTAGAPAPAPGVTASGLDPARMPSAGQLHLTPQDLLPVWGGGGSLQATPPPASPASVPASAPLPPRRPA